MILKQAFRVENYIIILKIMNLIKKQLTELLNHYQIPCNGIYINGKMPTRLKNGNYIINLNGHSHWVALIKHGIEYFYFDSYGVVAPSEVEKKIGTQYIYNHNLTITRFRKQFMRVLCYSLFTLHAPTRI